MFSRRSRKLFRRDDSGSATIEFTASATLLILVVFGTMETARALYIANFVSNAAPEATRYAMVRGATWKGTSCSAIQASECAATADNVTSYLDSLAPKGVSTSPNYLTVSTTWPGTTPSGAACSTQGVQNAPGCVVQVNVKYAFTFLFSFLPKQSLSLSSSSTVVISQ